jgi:hypothetical protein
MLYGIYYYIGKWVKKMLFKQLLLKILFFVDGILLDLSSVILKGTRKILDSIVEKIEV